jgi:hypothetical protein
MLRYVTLALALAFAAPAAADGHWGWDTGSGKTAKKHASGTAYADRRSRNRARVLAYERRDKDDTDRNSQCASKVRGLGTQWIGTEGAMDAAKKDWMERVRYDHGESFLDLTNAKEFESRCGRVSVGEVAGQVMYRCEIIARPCRPQMRETQATKKD